MTTQPVRIAIPVSYMHHGNLVVSQEIGPDHPKYRAELIRRHRRAVILAARFGRRHPPTAERWRREAATMRAALVSLASTMSPDDWDELDSIMKGA